MAGPAHLAVPFRLDADGSAVTVEQDSVDDVAQCVTVLAATPVGSRIELPAYGIPDLLFSQGRPPTQQILLAIQTWEPRADATVTAAPGPDARVAITVATRSSGSSR